MFFSKIFVNRSLPAKRNYDLDCNDQKTNSFFPVFGDKRRVCQSIFCFALSVVRLVKRPEKVESSYTLVDVFRNRITRKRSLVLQYLW